MSSKILVEFLPNFTAPLHSGTKMIASEVGGQKVKVQGHGETKYAGKQHRGQVEDIPVLNDSSCLYFPSQILLSLSRCWEASAVRLCGRLGSILSI